MRMRKKPNLEARLARCAEVLAEQPEGLRGQWNDKLGGNEIHLEIGCGKGRFINSLAEENPNALYIGLERERGALVMAAEKAVGRNLQNLRFIDGDAAALGDFFAPGEVARIYLNFSDPWPKKRQAKRRLTHRSFLAVYDRVLEDHGEIHIKTDNEKLFEFTLNELASYGYRMRNITFDLHSTELENVMTEYEERFVAQGLRIFRVEAYKEH